MRLAAARRRRELQGWRRRRHGDPTRPAAAGRRAGDQSRAARDDPRQSRRSRREARRRVDATVEISVPDGERIAERTANGRLGILGGLSILGTTGIVIPYSCSAWIHSIHRGVDVARASGCVHIGAATGETSEAAIRALYGLPDHALIEMGDFVGGLLKYLREHPVPRLTIAGGPAKMTKLAEGKLDLHSKRGAVDLAALGERVARAGGAPSLVAAIASANSGLARVRTCRGRGLRLAGARR